MNFQFLSRCAVAFLAISFVASLYSQEAPKVDASKFQLVLSSDRNTYELGEKPNFTIRIANKSDKEVYWIQALDGSEGGWRFPKCRVEVLDEGGKQVSLGRSIGCGMMNPLTVKDFVLTPAGKDFLLGGLIPNELHDFSVKKSGIYRVKFFYSTSSEKIQDYMGIGRMTAAASPQFQQMFERVPKFDLESNTLTITFTKAKTKKQP